MLTLALRFALQQDPQRPPPDPGVVIYPGAVEAPAQPGGASSSAVARTPRVAPEPARGASGKILVRVGDLVSVRGQEDNLVQGIGLVTGLSGTGDTAQAARLNLQNLLKTQNINVSLQDIASGNVAVVWVEATLPPGIKPGRRIDVRTSSIYDCKSLVGGTLVQTELMDMSGKSVYVTCGGPVSTGAFSAEGEGATATRNHLTVGTVPLGGKVEREVPSNVVSEHGFLYLDLRALKGSFGNT